MRLIKTSLLALVIAAAGTALPAQAATDTTTFNVKIVITESCDIHTTAATDVDFGSHARSTTAQQAATGTLTVNCTDGTPYNIGLDNGSNFSGTRRMSDGGTNYLGYGLFRDSAHSLAWGTTIGTNTLTGTGTAANQVISVYGQTVDTNAPAGSYSDIVTASVTY